MKEFLGQSLHCLMERALQSFVRLSENCLHAAEQARDGIFRDSLGVWGLLEQAV